MTRQEIVNFCRTLVGVRYRHCGRSVGLGLDCIGIVASVCDKFGVPYKDTKRYSRLARGMTLYTECQKYFIEIDAKEILPGDFGLFFWDPGLKLPQHAAVFTNQGMIHSYEAVGRVVEITSRPKEWTERLMFGFRFPGVQ